MNRPETDCIEMSTSDCEPLSKTANLDEIFFVGREVIQSAFFRLTDWIALHRNGVEPRRFDAINRGQSVSYISIQGSASVPGVHARPSGSPMDYVEPTYES